MTRDLSRLLRPNSIAVIGGGSWCASVINQCRKMGFSGDVWPVHPTRNVIADLAAYTSLDDLPDTPDAVFIGVNRHATVECVRNLSEMGAGGAVCFASGFLEAQAEDDSAGALQAELLDAAGDMPILGPNCYGFINYLDGALLWPDQHGGSRCDRGVAVLTQSSNVAINLTMQTRGLPLAYLVTVGNQAQIGMAEVGQALLEDDRVTALGLHIEGIGDIRSFEALSARARALGKRVIALKVGRSEQARAATVSHTASLAGSDAGACAFLDRLGIACVSSLAAMLETLKILHLAGPLASNRIASMSCSGGEASLMADTALSHDLVFPPLSDGQSNALRQALGSMVALANPLDYHTYVWGDAAAMGQVYTAMMQGSDLSMGIVVADFPRRDRCDDADWQDIITGARQASVATGRPIALLSTLPETLSETVAGEVISAGLIPLAGLSDALEGIAAAAYSPPTACEPVLLPGQPGSIVLVPEGEAKAKLAAAGLQVPRSIQVNEVGRLGAVAEEIGFPVVLKGQGLAHKSEAGAVALGLADAEAVIEAARSMPCDSFLLEEMITGAVAELLIGVVRDPAHGFVLTLAWGGILTELLQDRVSLLLPVGEEEILGALERLRIGRVLNGYRGHPGIDVHALVAAVLSVQAYVEANCNIVDEVEINPLICTLQSAIAVDALIREGRDGNDG